MNKDNETLESIAELDGQARKTGQEWNRYHLWFLEGLVLKQEGSFLEILLLRFTWAVWDSMYSVIQYHNITSWLRLEWAPRDGLGQPSAKVGTTRNSGSAMSSQILNISRYLDITMSLHNFLWCLTTLFYFQLLEFTALPLVLSLDASEKSLAPSS